jgi:hypothetical protein
MAVPQDLKSLFGVGVEKAFEVTRLIWRRGRESATSRFCLALARSHQKEKVERFIEDAFSGGNQLYCEINVVHFSYKRLGFFVENGESARLGKPPFEKFFIPGVDIPHPLGSPVDVSLLGPGVRYIFTRLQP